MLLEVWRVRRNEKFVVQENYVLKLLGVFVRVN